MRIRPGPLIRRAGLTPADLIRTVRVMAGVVLALAASLVLRQLAGLGVAAPVLAVVLALTFGRRADRLVGRVGPVSARGLALLETPVVALAAAGTGWLMMHVEWLGQTLFVLGLSVGILLRRYGPGWQAVGRFVSLPFVALMITPVPRGARLTGASILWAPVIAFVTMLCVLAVTWLFARRWPTAPRPELPRSARSRRRLDAPTRMAAQMAIGLGVAVVVGRLGFGAHWPWVVLSAFLVASGNRGRGDVAHKAGHRILGAVAGTLVASLVGGLIPVGSRVDLVLLFVVMAAGLLLRSRGYGWWAAAVTAKVALLASYYGQSGTEAVTARLVGVLVGCAIGVAAAWFVLPVRTTDVVRRRIADALAALSADLAEPAGQAAYAASLDRLVELTPTLRAHSRLSRSAPVRLLRTRPAGSPAADAVEALRRLDPLPCAPDERRRLRHATGTLRRAMKQRDPGLAEDLPPDLAVVRDTWFTTTRPIGAPAVSVTPRGSA